MFHTIPLAAASGLQAVEALFDRLFGARANPWRHLGALGFLLFWIVAASGIYLYAVLDTSVEGVYRSIEHLSRSQWYFGGVVRSLHRYASDAFVLVMGLHIVRELVHGRFHGFRWFTWLSGVPLLWLSLAAGAVGFWIVWDQLAQFSAIASMEWFDSLQLFAEPLARNFLTPGSVNDRFFSLLVFLHIGLPLLVLLGLWVHIQRVTRPDTRPASALTWGTLAALVGLSVAVPVQSLPAADLSVVPATLKLDWFYLAPNALMYQWSPVALWWLAAGITVALVTLPWMPRVERQPVPVVDPGNCNGCGRCFADCPYAAITMQPRSDRRIGTQLAVVDAALCASCGICAGACPSSTPFRSIAELVSGIDMPQLPIGQLRSRLKLQIARLKGEVKLVLFGCDHAADVRVVQSLDTAALSLLCTGQLPPAFVEYALRQGADGVLVAGCGECDCVFRLGNTWAEQRLRDEREPHLRRTVSPRELRVVWAGKDRARLERELAEFRAELTRGKAGTEPDAQDYEHA
ncbi:MAG TPA: hydrogenase iron-sulfur subunit [Burkholderiales bacterium]|nr:hydrogenase iron-sulfur subunit [Burkholderiales bacterium]